MPVPGYSAGIAYCGSCHRVGFGNFGPVFRSGIHASVWGQGWISALLVSAVFGLLAGWGFFFPMLSWPLVAAGMMVSVGLAGGVVAVSAITSSPTLVTFSGVRESRLSPSELELSLDSLLFPRLRGVVKSDSRSFGTSDGLGGRGGGCQVLLALSPASPLGSPVLPGVGGGGGNPSYVPPFPSGRRAAWKCGSTQWVELVAPTTTAHTLMSSEHNHSHTDVQRTQTQHHLHTITTQQRYLKRRNKGHTQIHDVLYTRFRHRLRSRTPQIQHKGT